MNNALPISVIFSVLGSVIIFNALLTRKNKRKPLLIDELLLGSFHLLLAVYYPIVFTMYGINTESLFLTANILAFLTLGLLGSFVIIEKIRLKKNPKLIKQRSAQSFKENFIKNYDEKNKYKRRIIHILPGLIIVPTYLIGKLLSPIITNAQGLSVFLIAVFGTCFVIMFTIADLVRIKAPQLMPDWASKLFSKGLKKEEVEQNTFSTSSAMVLAISPWILAGMFVFMIISLITSISDAMAAVMGFRFGRHHFPHKSTKTVEGYLGGIITTFGLVLVCCALLSSINPLYIVFVALMLAGSFFLVDVLNLPIDDNKINPQVVGLVSLLIIGII